MAKSAGRRVATRKQRLKEDFPYFCRSLLRIKAKDGSIIPLELNKAQLYLHAKIEAQRAKIGKVRCRGLKGRQQGFSTLVQARFFWRLMQSKGLRAFILTHEIEATNNLFEMAERFCNESPVRVSVSQSNAKELHFSGNDCGYKVGTAGNKAVGRSSTLQLFHGSEVAYWPNASAHKAGAIQTVPDLPGTEIILESTANGVGGMFYEDWKATERGEGEYINVFVPWFWQDEYRRPAPGFKRTADEERLAKRYKLDNEQLAWRRNKIYELKPSEGGNADDLFKQEYPCDADEAFLFSGRMVFTSSHLMEARAECFKPKFVGEVSMTTGSFTERPDGRMQVFSKPKSGNKYVIGADVAEGLVNGDYSTLDVLEVPSGKQAATWRGHIDPDQYGVLLAKIGNWYNGALIGVERNNHGLTTVTKLRDLHYRNQYAQEDLEHISDGKETKKLGWLTTGKSKLKIIDQLAAELRDGDHGIFCQETIDEMGTYTIDEEGRYGAKSGCFDDRVMSRAIAGEMLRQFPKNRSVIPPAKTFVPVDRRAGY